MSSEPGTGTDGADVHSTVIGIKEVRITRGNPTDFHELGRRYSGHSIMGPKLPRRISGCSLESSREVFAVLPAEIRIGLAENREFLARLRPLACLEQGEN
jgi:hypothetical protein